MTVSVSAEWNNMYKPVEVTKHDPKLLYQFLKRLNTVIPYDTEIPLLDKYPREMKYTHGKNTYT